MNFESFAQIIWRQRVVVAATFLIGLVCCAFALTMSHKYSATAVVLAGGGASQSASVLDPTKDPVESALNPSDVPMLVSSSTVSRRVASDLHLSPEHAAKLSVKAKLAGVNTIPITATDRDPGLAVAEANAVAREVGRFQQQIAESRYDQLIADLKTQLGLERTTLDGVDQQIAAITSADPYVSDANGTSALNARLVALEAQRDTVRAQLMGDAAAAQKAAERPTLTRDLANREIVENDPVFQNLRTQYGKDLAAYNQLKAGYTSNFPGLRGAADEAQREGQSLSAATAAVTKNPGLSTSYVAAELDANKAESTFASDRSQLASLDQAVADITNHLTSSRGVNVSLSSLLRERQAGNQAYEAISDRLAQAIADRSQAASVNSVVMLDEAVSASPTLLSRPLVVSTALAFLFTWLAVSLAFLVDQSDGRLRTRTTIEELYGSPVLTNVV
jgi:uncharacterized protein involved in exopolysaccharide biosynthesis